MKKKNNFKNTNNFNDINSKILIIKEEQETYGQVINALGNNRLMVKCFSDGKDRVCTIRGSMRKKIWINKNDIVLVSLRDFQDDKADIIHKYDEIQGKSFVVIGTQSPWVEAIALDSGASSVTSTISSSSPASLSRLIFIVVSLLKIRGEILKLGKPT
jgi:translation initiation factor 1A